MGLADDLKNVPVRQSLCSIARAREHFDGEDLKVLNQTIALIAKREPNDRAPGGVSQSWLAKTLTNNGFKVSPKTLNSHFRGACSCGSV
jgi:hypothetical protein